MRGGSTTGVASIRSTRMSSTEETLKARTRKSPGLFVAGAGPAQGLRGAPSGFSELFVLLLTDQGEPVADVADGADQVLVVGAELGAETPDVDVHGARAAVVVVAPHLGEQLLAGKHTAWVLRQVLQEFELL